MSNSTGVAPDEVIPNVLLLAAIDRAERHRAKGGPGGVPVWVIRAHLHVAARSSRARYLRARMTILEGVGLLERGSRAGVVVWALSHAGKEQLRAAQDAGSVPELPESPQHIAWRQARAAAQARIDGFAGELRDATARTCSMLDDVQAGEPAVSDEWFAMAERLQRTCRRTGSAIHCLHEWAEPTDDQADIDDRREPGDERLEPAEHARRRARRTSRRNITLWEDSTEQRQ